MATLRTPVLIVGAGVAGSVLALELAHHGVRSTVVERSAKPPHQPGLTLVSGRSMELLRRLGLTGWIRGRGLDPDSPADVIWTRRLDQPPVHVSQVPSANELLRAYAGSTDGTPPVEPYSLLPAELLIAGLRDSIRGNELVDLREGWTFADLRPEPTGTVATLLEAGTGTRHVVQARFLAGCDGAQSTVRRCLGVPMEHLTPPVHHCTVWFRSADVARTTAHPCTVIASGVTLTWHHDRKLWIGHLPLSAEEAALPDPAALLARLGIRAGTAEVLGVAQSEEALRVAAAYRQGTVYLAGESAHRFHPVGDTVDTCVGDAVDLGWKLAATVRGWGGPALLASYEDERRRRALIDRELAARALETRHRFGRLAAAGASAEVLAGVLSQEAPQVDVAGTAEAGARLPAVRLTDGANLFDRLGPQLTLVDLTEERTGEPMVAAADKRGIPMTHLSLADATVRASRLSRLLLVRPDQQVAWDGDHAPADWDRVLDAVTGRVRQDHVNA
ncbi:FAD-dependent monooxygenase [Symbioplanes lichenis]|uniref:FAD-dependent monooxygenase n=1 Tax=Symbioplanes lichenis TaxID=1629072 RepID=UPI0027394F84|nr:FAD-dependent monooxygenase [Actinoplanes lichenis]